MILETIEYRICLVIQTKRTEILVKKETKSEIRKLED